MSDSLTYADAGVDIDKANKLVGTISEIAKKTSRTGVIGEIGGFGGLFALPPGRYEEPVLVSIAKVEKKFYGRLSVLRTARRDTGRAEGMAKRAKRRSRVLWAPRQSGRASASFLRRRTEGFM